MGKKIKLSSGTIVEFIAKFGAEEEMKASEAANVSADLSQEGWLLVNWANVMTATEAVQKPGEAPKQLLDLVGDDPDQSAMIQSFREHFSSAEWRGLLKAFNLIFPIATDAQSKSYKLEGRTATLSTGAVVEFVKEWGPREQLQAARRSAAPLNMTRAEWLQLNWLTTMVGIQTFTPVGGTPTPGEKLVSGDGRDAAVAFRALFTPVEWGQITEAYNRLFPQSAGEDDFTIQS